MGFFYGICYAVKVPLGSGPVASAIESNVCKDLCYKDIDISVERSGEDMKILLVNSVVFVPDSSFRVLADNHVIILDTEELLETGKEKILENVVIKQSLIEMFKEYLLERGVTKEPSWMIDYTDTYSN